MVQKCGALGTLVGDSGPEEVDTATGDVLRPSSLSPTSDLDLTGPPGPQEPHLDAWTAVFSGWAMG